MVPDAYKQEARTDKRLAVIREKSATCDDYSVKIREKVFDLSQGGLFIKTSDPFYVGFTFHLTLHLITSHEPIIAIGRVVYSKRGYGMGIRLLNVRSQDAEKIQQLVGNRESHLIFSDRRRAKSLFSYEIRNRYGAVISRGHSDQWFFQS